MVSSLHGNFAKDTYLATLDFDHDAWTRQGGCFGVQLLDSLFQIGFLLPSHDPMIVTYAGGFEVREAHTTTTTASCLPACLQVCNGLTPLLLVCVCCLWWQAGYFLKRPRNGVLYAYLLHDSKVHCMGRKKHGGDFFVYDEDGSLVLALKAIVCIKGTNTETTRMCSTDWQPLHLPTPSGPLLAAAASGGGGSVSDLALAVRSAALALRAAADGPVVFRLLEVGQQDTAAAAAANRRAPD